MKITGVTGPESSVSLDGQEVVTRIPLDDIAPHPANRKVGGFDEAKLNQLAESIRAVGVQQPAVVRPLTPRELDSSCEAPDRDPSYQLVAGERRWRASKIAGKDTLPCVVRELDDVTALKIQTIENLQREDVHPLDEAEGYKRLISDAGYDVELIAQDLGKSNSHVYQRLKLLEMIPPARNLLVEGTITVGHAILIARLEQAAQKECVSYLRPRNYGEIPSVRELGFFIHNRILLDLAKATFKKDDAELVRAAGPCTLCPKRTGYQPALFADIAKNDYCLDRACFQGKIAALVSQREKELKKVKAEHIKVILGPLDFAEEQKLQKKGVLARYNWEECKAKDKGAMRALVVAGTEAGKLTWGRKPTRQAYEKPPEQVERERKEREKRKRETAIRLRMYERLIEEAESAITGFGALPVELLRLIVRRTFIRVDSNVRNKLAKMHGAERPPKEDYKNNEWSRPHESDVFLKTIDSFGESGLQLLLVKCLAIEHVLSGYSYGSKKGPTYDALTALELDPEEIKKKVAAEYDEERSKKIRRAKSKSKKAKTDGKTGTCRVCGCTETTPCLDPETGEPCFWVEPDLCSACVSKHQVPATEGGEETSADVEVFNDGVEK